MQLTSLTKAELSTLLSDWGEPSFRAKQVYAWLMKGARPQQMANLPKGLRDRLDTLPYGGVAIDKELVSAKDGTKKYLFRLDDENLVEGVLMRYHYGNTACISTQVGCNMGCKFCASTLEGCVRNLTAGEMCGEILAIERDEPHEEGHRAVTNIVLMGSGEPLDNYGNVVQFLSVATAPDGLGVSPRNISLSTCGIVPRMETFAGDAPHVTLSVSLHAHNDAMRSQIMPVNRKYPIQDVLAAADAYAEKTGRRVIYEYALIDGVNASMEDADALSKLLRGKLCHVNLIPLNPVKERGLCGVSRTDAQAFCDRLCERHISATVRREMGTDIDGACGQLRRRVIHEVRE